MLEERIDRVRDLRDFRFQVIELGAGADEEQVAEIFVRINSEGVQLNQADFILTLMSVHWEKGRRELEEFSRAAVDPAVAAAEPAQPVHRPEPRPAPARRRRGRLPPRSPPARLQPPARQGPRDRGRSAPSAATSSSRGSRRRKTQVLDLHELARVPQVPGAAGFRSRKMITSENAVIFSYALWLIGRLDFGLDLPIAPPRDRAAGSSWRTRPAATPRHRSRQLESDLGRIADLAPSTMAQPSSRSSTASSRANFTSDYWEISLPNRLDTSRRARRRCSPTWLRSTCSTPRCCSARSASASCSIPPSPRLERSSGTTCFPKAHLASLGITGTRQTNAIANMAFLDWSENADDQRSRTRATTGPSCRPSRRAARLKRQIEHHALPVGWEQLDYPTFLERRRQLIARVVQEGFATLWGERPKPRQT